ncbi:MAG: hypothetical protein CM15mP54_09050 [Paracoccaceae bacterium]|nr:MAG: hypothetical protein CM15mP54_09050 [Paracoccaceae bacterium]
MPTLPTKFNFLKYITPVTAKLRSYNLKYSVKMLVDCEFVEICI